MPKLGNLEFLRKDLGPLNYFLDIDVSRNPAGIFLSQHKYAAEILDKVGMSQCKPALFLLPHQANSVMMLVFLVIILSYLVSYLCWGLYSILPSPIQISPILFNKFAYLCMMS